MTEERLQKLLSQAGIASRRAAEEWIRDGRVTINGEVAVLGSKADPEHDAVRVDGKPLVLPTRHTYVLLYKPAGFVTTRSDPQGRPTVFDLLPPKYRKLLVPAGRLDYDSEGLLVLTDDGELVHRITHPRYGCLKTYAVKVKGVPSEAQMQRFRQGMVLDRRRTAAAKASLRHHPRQGKGEKNSWWTVQLMEGRKRQIREMFFRLGHPVQRLKRIAIGGVSDRHLTPGSYRMLEPREIDRLRGGK